MKVILFNKGTILLFSILSSRLCHSVDVSRGKAFKVQPEVIEKSQQEIREGLFCIIDAINDLPLGGYLHNCKEAIAACLFRKKEPLKRKIRPVKLSLIASM